MVEGLVDPGPNEVTEAGDGPGPERGLHEPAQAVVVGVVAEHEGGGVPAAEVHPLHLGVDDGVADGVGRIAAHVRVAQQRVDVGVAGQHPAVEHLGVMHRVGGPQAGVLLVRRLDEAVLERVECHVVHHCSFTTGRWPWLQGRHR